MQILDGQKIADELLAALKLKPTPKKFLAGFVVGSDAASLSFQQLKKKTGEALGVDYRIYELPENIANDAAREEIGKIAQHTTCGGVIVQLPLPTHLNRHYVLNAIPPEKDPDVIGERALGAFYCNRSRVLPPAVATLQEIIKRVEPLNPHFSILTSRIAIVGPGFLVGRPIAVWLINNHVANLDIIGRDGDLSILKHADLVILGAGQPAMIKPEMLKNGAGVVDFSYSKVDGKLVGDLDISTLLNAESVKRNKSEGSQMPYALRLTPLAFYTPTPGGTGPILVAKLFENFYALNP